MNEKLTYTIAEMAERFGVTYRTLHYYESKVGLQINRNSSGDRIYSESDVEMFESIFDLKSKGMTLDGIRKLFIEKGVIKSDPISHMVVIDENTMELKDLILEAIGEKVSDILKTTNNKLDQVIRENEELRETLRQIQRQSNEHYSKVDEQLTAWRNRKPWYKAIFKKE